jgi:YD repeat-containing protein
MSDVAVIESVSDDHGFLEPTIKSIQYDPVGNASKLVRFGGQTTTQTLDANGQRQTYSYDAVGQITGILTAIGATVVARTTFGYDPVGNRVWVQDLNGSLTTYSYDAKYRLIADNTTGTNPHWYTYSYDVNDNRLTSNETGVLTTYAYDIANRLTTAIAGVALTTYQYSAEGSLSLVIEPSVTYTYGQDGEFKLAWQTASTGGTRTWTYDANSRLASYSGPVPAGVVTVVWDGDDYLELRS